MYIPIKLPWVSLRENVIADDTPISVFQYNNWPTSNTLSLRGSDLKDSHGIMIAAYAGSAADKVITSYNLYGKSRMNGAIMLLLTGIMQTGSQACTIHPITEASLTNHYWIDTVTVTGGLLLNDCEILDNDSDRICMLKFDHTIFEELYIEIDLAASGIDHFYAMACGY
jgi:hypothetical protein